MFEGEDIAFNGLEVCSYRHLQGMAKNMGLPSNVKKVHLIEMIRAKKYCTESDLKAIVDRVKMERKVNAQVKKKKAKKRPFRVQGAEISSTSNSHSPPITLTPRRSSEFVIQYSPDISRRIMKYRQMPNMLCTGNSSLQPLKRHIDSDRVLRSFTSGRRPDYRIMEQSDSIINALSQDPMQEFEQERVQQIRQERAYQSVTNVTIQKHRPMNTMVLNADRLLVPMSRSLNIAKPAKRQRKLSGIYPLEPREKPDHVPTVGFRRSDGRVTKINAVIQKPLCNALLPKNNSFPAKKHAFVTKRATLTVQDMINYKIDHPNDPIRAIEGPSTSRLYNKIESQVYSDYQKDDRQVQPSQVGMPQKRIEPICSISEMTGRQNLNKPRKVYKACPRPKTNANKGWNYNVECQEQETDAITDWNIYDINSQLLDKTEQNASNIQTNYRVNETIPVSTNYKVTQGRITEPVSRDHQVEYQIYNQQLTKRISNIASSDINDQTLNAEKSVRNIDNAKSDANDQNFDVEMADKTYYAKSEMNDQPLNEKIGVRNIGHAKSNSEPTNKDMVYPRSVVEDQQTHEITVRSDAKDQPINKTTDKNIPSSNIKDNPCTQELTVRIVDVRSDAKYQQLNKGTVKNMLYAASDMKDRYNQEAMDKNAHARSDVKDQRCGQKVTVIDPDKTDSKYQRSNLGTTYMNMIYARSDMKDQRYRQVMHLRSMDVRSAVKNQRQETNNNIYVRSDQEHRNDYKFESADTSSQYPNMAALDDAFPNDDYSQEPVGMRGDSNFRVYYHKKIRAEQIKNQRGQDSERLPRINDAFTQFHNVQYRGLSQPLYVQVSAESERVLPVIGPNNTCMIETLYNFKNQFITNEPVLMIATTDTYCTYTTNTISTVVARPAVPDFRNDAAHERRAGYSCQQHAGGGRPDEYLNPDRPRSFGCYEVLSSSTNSLETTNSQELGANATIPDMVEDALELISQDGDYMERIGMDVRMQCILCEWAGPKIILEYHIRKEHSQDIQEHSRDEWSVLLTLGELSSGTWSNQVAQCGAVLYVLSAKYTDAGVLLLALSMIPNESEMTRRGRITVYNKISGRPYFYESEINPLPDSMPYEYGLDCLNIDISNLDLIPNSANLRLVNGELVGCHGNAGVGRPELNGIEIVVYVKLMD